MERSIRYTGFDQHGCIHETNATLSQANRSITNGATVPVFGLFAKWLAAPTKDTFFLNVCITRYVQTMGYQHIAPGERQS